MGGTVLRTQALTWRQRLTKADPVLCPVVGRDLGKSLLLSGFCFLTCVKRLEECVGMESRSLNFLPASKVEESMVSEISYPKPFNYLQ